MSIKSLALIAAAAALVVGCAAPTPRSSFPAQAQAPVAQRSATHRYAIVVKDKTGTPVAGANVVFTPSGGTVDGDAGTNCITKETGRCTLSLEVLRDPQYKYVESYVSTLEYKVSKPGYFSKTGKAFSSYGGSVASRSSPVVERTEMLYVPDDYMAPGFGRAAGDRELRDKATQFLTLIQLQSLLNDAEVPLSAFNTSNFKGKKYFQLKLNSTTQFNSLKLDKYAVGKRLFDDSLRKVLNPLNEHISSPKAFYGYDLIINGYSKSFAEKYATAEKIEYRFLMPQEAVRKYKDKDISGQQLLDASVILMNDERIDMKLQ